MEEKRNKIGFDYGVKSHHIEGIASNKIYVSASCCYYEPETEEARIKREAYEKTFRYRFKQSWVAKRWRAFKYRLSVIKRALFDIDSIDNY